MNNTSKGSSTQMNAGEDLEEEKKKKPTVIDINTWMAVDLSLPLKSQQSG